MSRPRARSGVYVRAIGQLRAKGSRITAAWLMLELKFAKAQAYNCLAYLASRHVIEPEARGVYRFAA